ncbi:hypothetical protein [Tellurirhabdus bombi]|uniref:hypothetical protein n=1 Tax=Tellurirhabdus bombi TaxID=2907205 RepID=UPI001F2C02EB|nr:hypothetical protein [Tellurirhabdus bombi]
MAEHYIRIKSPAGRYYCVTKRGINPSSQPDRWMYYPEGLEFIDILTDQDGDPFMPGAYYVQHRRVHPRDDANDDTYGPFPFRANQVDVSAPRLAPLLLPPTHGSYLLNQPLPEGTVAFYALCKKETVLPIAQEGRWVQYGPNPQPIRFTLDQDGDPLRLGDQYKLFRVTNQVTLADLEESAVALAAQDGQPEPEPEGGWLAHWPASDYEREAEFLLTKQGGEPQPGDEWQTEGTDYFLFFKDRDGDKLVRGNTYYQFARPVGTKVFDAFLDAFSFIYDPLQPPTEGDTLDDVVNRGAETDKEIIVGGQIIRKFGDSPNLLFQEVIQNKLRNRLSVGGMPNNRTDTRFYNEILEIGISQILDAAQTAINQITGKLGITDLPLMPDAPSVLVAKSMNGLFRVGMMSVEEFAALVAPLVVPSEVSDVLQADILAVGISYHPVGPQGNPSKEGTVWVRTRNGILGAMLWIEDPAEGATQPFGSGWQAKKWLPFDYDTVRQFPNDPWNALLRVNPIALGDMNALQPGRTYTFMLKILGQNKIFAKEFTMPTASTSGVLVIAQQNGGTDPGGPTDPTNPTTPIIEFIDVATAGGPPSTAFMFVRLKMSNSSDVPELMYLHRGVPGDDNYPGWQSPYIPMLPVTNTLPRNVLGYSDVLTQVPGYPQGYYVPKGANWFLAFKDETDTEFFFGFWPATIWVKLGNAAPIQFDVPPRADLNNTADFIRYYPASTSYTNHYNSLNDPRGMGGNLGEFDVDTIPQ